MDNSATPSARPRRGCLPLWQSMWATSLTTVRMTGLVQGGPQGLRAPRSHCGARALPIQRLAQQGRAPGHGPDGGDHQRLQLHPACRAASLIAATGGR